MSLDQNLFTLIVSPSPSDPNTVDLIDPSGTAHYRKHTVPGAMYRADVYDPLSESLLATATAPSPTSKHKTLQLHNPMSLVELQYTGTLSFRWGFKWEEHEFEWKREECFMIRKPDPAVLVAITKEPAGRLRSTTVQILDYNLNRFDIEDRKGLEIVILTALLTFHDANDAYHARGDGGASGSVVPAPLANILGRGRQASDGGVAPPPYSAEPGTAAEVPLRAPLRTGVERVAELHALRTAQGTGEANEVEVSAEGSADDYAQYVEGLLKDEAMLFVTVRSASAAEVSKVLRVVEEIKRLRHRAGLTEEEELHQYVAYDNEAESSSSVRKPPRRINLDDPSSGGMAGLGRSASGSYATPRSVVIHLSKIDMPELLPKNEIKPKISAEEAARQKAWEKEWARMQAEARAVPQRHETKGKGKELSKAQKKEREKMLEKDRKLAEKEQKKLSKQSSSRSPKSPNRPPASSSSRSYPSSPSSDFPSRPGVHMGPYDVGQASLPIPAAAIPRVHSAPSNSDPSVRTSRMWWR